MKKSIIIALPIGLMIGLILAITGINVSGSERK